MTRGIVTQTLLSATQPTWKSAISSLVCRFAFEGIADRSVCTTKPHHVPFGSSVAPGSQSPATTHHSTAPTTKDEHEKQYEDEPITP